MHHLHSEAAPLKHDFWWNSYFTRPHQLVANTTLNTYVEEIKTLFLSFATITDLFSLLALFLLSCAKRAYESQVIFCDILLSHLSFISMLLLSSTPDITPWISMALVYYNIIFITLPYNRKHFLSFSVYSIKTGDINHLFSHTLDLEVSNSKWYVKLEITSNYIIQWFLTEANDRLSNNLSSSIIYSVQARREEYNKMVR